MRASSCSVVRGPVVSHAVIGLLAIGAFVALMAGGALAAVVLGFVPLSIIGFRRRSLRRYSVTKSELRAELINQRGR
jgi:hypothetical protein